MEKWLEPHTSLSTRLQTQSMNNFEESFYNLMNDSCNGKTLESERNKVNVTLVKTREAVIENSDNGLLKSINIFDENLVAVTSRRVQIYSVMPTLVGVAYSIVPSSIPLQGNHKSSKSVP